MEILNITYGALGEPYRTLPGNLLNRLLCCFGVHGIGCRGLRNHDPAIGRWHTRF
jgi:hypothetical protein